MPPKTSPVKPSSIVATAQPTGHVVRIRDVQTLEAHLFRLGEVLRELAAFQPGDTRYPLKGQTRDRWYESIQSAQAYFQRFLPQEVSHGSAHASNGS